MCRFLDDPWLFFCFVIVVHESLVDPEQINCLLFFRKILQLLHILLFSSIFCMFWSLSNSDCMILRSIFSHGGQLRDSYITITKCENQPDLTAIRTYFTRWLIVWIRTTSLIQIHTIFVKSYVFYELPIRMNLYEWPTPNPAPKPTRHWGLDKSYKIVWVRSYELATS